MSDEIIIQELYFSYEDSSRLFEGLSFVLPSQGFHAMIGRSGVGKSTLARIMCRLVPDSSAKRVQVPERILYCHNRERLPCWQTVKSHLENVSENGKEELLNCLVKGFFLDGLLNRKPHQLSSGQQNRINLLRYLIQEFDFLIMDEVLNNVDEFTRLKILAIVKKIFPNKGFLYVSHQFSDVVAFARNIVFLKPDSAGVRATFTNGLDLAEYSETDVVKIAGELRRAISYG